MNNDSRIRNVEPTLPLTVAIGRRVRAAREASNLSQAALGHRVGLSRVSVNKIEQGKRKQVKEVLVRKIALATGKPEAYFYGQDISLELSSYHNMHPELQKAIVKLAALPLAQQQKWAKVIENLIGVV